MKRLREMWKDESGSAMVVGFVMMVMVTGGAILWLTMDVGRAINAASEADSVAFQSARAAAQAIDPTSLRANRPMIDPVGAQASAVGAATQLLAANGSVGRVTLVEVGPAGDRVTVLVELTEAGRTVIGRGTARLAVGVTHEGDG